MLPTESSSGAEPLSAQVARAGATIAEFLITHTLMTEGIQGEFVLRRISSEISSGRADKKIAQLISSLLKEESGGPNPILADILNTKDLSLPVELLVAAVKRAYLQEIADFLLRSPADRKVYQERGELLYGGLGESEYTHPSFD